MWDNIAFSFDFIRFLVYQEVAVEYSIQATTDLEQGHQIPAVLERLFSHRQLNRHLDHL